ncbi:microtubule-destabilizing protein 60-like isoform X2 [Henckelia pumila]|uniref:microtubule-destabilizing protein 60-like isoform X2 n=1 Tax=Henckelia pumila TaxID=405737 RepID=UPI003C6E4904
MESPNRKFAQKMKEGTKPMEFRLHTQQRAVHRSIFDSSVAIKLYINERQKKQVEKLLKTIEEEEVRMMRRSMIPRAQLMPLFDKPFLPRRSTRPLTIPRDPSFIKNYSGVLYL